MEPSARAEEKASIEIPPARRPAARGEGDLHAPNGAQADAAKRNHSAPTGMQAEGGADDLVATGHAATEQGSDEQELRTRLLEDGCTECTATKHTARGTVPRADPFAHDAVG